MMIFTHYLMKFTIQYSYLGFIFAMQTRKEKIGCETGSSNFNYWKRTIENRKIRFGSGSLVFIGHHTGCVLDFSHNASEGSSNGQISAVTILLNELSQSLSAASRSSGIKAEVSMYVRVIVSKDNHRPNSFSQSLTQRIIFS